MHRTHDSSTSTGSTLRGEADEGACGVTRADSGVESEVGMAFPGRTGPVSHAVFTERLRETPFLACHNTSMSCAVASTNAVQFSVVR